MRGERVNSDGPIGFSVVYSESGETRGGWVWIGVLWDSMCTE
jgi:hypothetical protein